MILDIFAISIILLLGFAPMLLSVWGIHTIANHPRFYSRRRRTTDPWSLPSASPCPWVTSPSSLNWLMPESYRGDTSCRFNAHSPFLRCAVNPEGPCQSCTYYEPSPHLTQQ